MTYISWFSDFASYLEGFLMYKHLPLDNESLWLDADLKIKVSHCDPYFMVQ